MATTPALTLHLSRLARHFPFSSSPLPTPFHFPRARLLLRLPDLPFRRTRSFSTSNFSRRFSVAASTGPGLSDDGIHDERYDVIVVGGGHAGCEAALASAHLGAKTLLLTLNIDRIAWQPCNPAVGGPAKSQLVHEVDALGGEIGKISDRCYLQKRVLNASRGPAVRALRAQTDKREYAMEMRKIVERLNYENVLLFWLCDQALESIYDLVMLSSAFATELLAPVLAKTHFYPSEMSSSLQPTGAAKQ